MFTPSSRQVAMIFTSRVRVGTPSATNNDTANVSFIGDG